MPRPTVAVIGGGAWGLALAGAAARTGGTTLLLSRRAHDGALPAGVALARDEHEVAERARLVLLAVPSGVAREVARGLGAHVDGGHFVVHGVRGLVGEAMESISSVVRDETPVRRVGALGGPALAADLLAGRPSVMVCGSHYPEVNRALQQAFGSPTLRLYATDDLLGLEWASALVGCIAIGVGYARGVGLGPGLMAAVITRAVEEGARLAAAAGGKERTLLGLAGYGDLLASIAQSERPEVLVGEALAAGKTLEEALSQVNQRVEAVELTARIVTWAEAAGIRAPVFGALARGILRGRTTDVLIRELMTGPIEA
ncbi:MAG TPA: NAD(P)-binding domain-containing protein [Polyangiaceae bacterium]|jgi:glycerol-3-phosphate dehydrogenase (NAD(P)+)